MKIEIEKNYISGSIKELVSLSQKGNIQCFTVLFNQNKPALYARALQFFGSGHEAKDVLQDTYIKAFSRIRQLRDPDKINSWLHSILRNECLLLKRRQRKVIRTDNVFPSGLSSNLIQTSDLHKWAEKKELHQGIMNWLSLLNERKQAVVLLRFFSGYNSYEEIAKLLAIPVGTVRSRLAIAKKELLQMADNVEDVENLLHISGNNLGEQKEQFSKAWPSFYDGHRNRFLNLFKKDLSLRFTSGKMGRGLQRWEQEWDEDFESGVRFRPDHVVNSNHLVIVEGPIINPPDKPNHCPPYGSMVLFHQHGTVYRAHIHYASREK